ncbi:MAG TPA: DUF4230 domain-containing protein, partial [Chthonomonadaceae bacterium]|nr:DUF4230 domain-containing protein [Chthonomonadaceae bacterium]
MATEVSSRLALRRAGRADRWAPACGLAACAVVLAAFTIAGVLAGWRHGPQRNLDIDPRPVIVSLRQLGDLHTVKMTMKDVLRTSSEQDADGWLHGMPGADAIAHWATHNQALVVAEGSVEAGIDLSRISDADVTRVRRADGTMTLRVRLPQPDVYPPNVTVRVESAEAGLLWRDDNIVPRAQAEAAERFRD